jgi:uncharacterized protein YjbI with pentapeptide repeats
MRERTMIVCPHCSYENEDSAMNCANCRINLQSALENPHEAVRHNLERGEGPPPEAQAGNRVVRAFKVIGLLLAIPASGFLAFLFAFLAGWSDGSARSGYMIAAWFWLVVAVVCILAAIAVLLPRRLRPRLLRGLRILALIGLSGGLLFGLMRLTLVILPEHAGRSLIIQYKLGERDFRGIDLKQADLREAKLRKASLSGADLSDADLAGAQLYGADLTEAGLGYANLSEADLHGTNLSRADLSGANLSGANLSGADLSRANLYQASLSGASLGDADLSEAYLYQADLRDASLNKANLRGAVLDDATQIDAKWRLVTEIVTTGAQGRDLSGADLREANLSRAYLGRANLTGAKVTDEQLADARSLEGTILPDGTVHK